MGNERCEPAEGLRDVDGWHWVATRTGNVCREWQCGEEARWWDINQYRSPHNAACEEHWRYLAPVATPESVAALVKAAREAVRGFDIAGRHIPLYRECKEELAAALAPFKDIP